MRQFYKKIFLTAVAYFIAGRLALLLAIPPGYATPVWPAVGFALGLMLIWGYRVWPGIILGSFLVNIGTALDTSSLISLSKSAVIPLSISCGTTLQTVIGAFLVRRTTGYPRQILDEKNIARFLVLGGPIACLVAATWGVTTLFLAGAVNPNDYFFNWWNWWVGDTIGIILIAPVVLLWEAQKSVSSLWKRMVPVAPFVCLLVFVISFFVYASGREQERLTLEFERKTEHLVNVHVKSVDRYIDTLHALRSFFNSSQGVTQEEFGRFVRPLLERLPGIRAFSFDRVVEGPRKSVVVQYLEPLEENTEALGYDVYADPVRREALEKALESGEAVATAPLQLIQEPEGQPGVLLFLPVTQQAGSAGGFVVAVFQVGVLIESAWAGIDREGMEIQVYDTTGGSEQLIYGNPKPVSQKSKFLPIQYSKSYDFAGRRREIRCFLTPDYLASHRSWSAWAVLVGGLFLTGILGTGLLSFAGQVGVIEELVRKRTRELEQSTQSLKEKEGAMLSLLEDLRTAEKTLTQKSEELARSNQELEAFNKQMVGREMRMIELKKQVNQLCLSLGKPPLYDLTPIELPQTKDEMPS